MWRVSCKAWRLLSFMFRTFSPFREPETIITHKFYLLLTTHVWFGTHNWRKISICWSLSRHSHWWWPLDHEESMQKKSIANSNSPHLPCIYRPLKWFIVCPPDLFDFNASPNIRVSHSSQLVVPFAKTAAYFLLVLLDCGTVYQQIMYIMTLLDNLKGVFKILSYAFKVARPSLGGG